MGCYNSIVVDAPADQVWNAVRDFHDMSKFPNVVTSYEAVGDVPGTQVGAKRVLNDAFHETLHGLDDSECVMRYSIDDGPEAVLERERVWVLWRGSRFSDYLEQHDLRAVDLQVGEQRRRGRGILLPDLQRFA